MLRSSSNSLSRLTLNSNRNSSAKKSGVKPSALLFYQSSNQKTSKQPSQDYHYGSDFQNSQCKQNALISSRKNIHKRSLPKIYKQNEFSANNFSNHPITCFNHVNIIAEFVSCTAEGEQIFYCEKCARLLVDQGFQVSPISQQQTNNSVTSKKKKEFYEYPYYQERCQQVKEFENRVQELLTGTNSKVEQLKDVLMQSQQFYGQQIQEITNYFQEIIQQLQFQKNKCYNHILKERAQAEQQSRNTLKTILEYEKQLTDIVSDISQNIDEVYTVERNNYEMVLTSFLNKVENIEYQIFQRNGGINIRDIEFRKIQFMGVPDSINSLSEIVLKSCGSEGDGSGGILGSISLTGDFTQKNQLSNDNTQFLNKNNSLMFSFDGQKMKSYSQFINQASRKSNGYDEYTDTVKCKNDKEYLIGGIKEVQISDAIGEVQFDDDELLYCAENEK